MLKYLFIGLPNILTISRPKRTMDPVVRIMQTPTFQRLWCFCLWFFLTFEGFFFFLQFSLLLKTNVYLQKVSINVEHVLKNTNFLFLSFVMDNWFKSESVFFSSAIVEKTNQLRNVEHFIIIFFKLLYLSEWTHRSFVKCVVGINRRGWSVVLLLVSSSSGCMQAIHILGMRWTRNGGVKRSVITLILDRNSRFPREVH